MWKSAIICAALLAPVPAAAEAALPDEAWGRTIACSGHLFVTIENLDKAENQTDDSRKVTDLMTGAFASWYGRAQELPGYTSAGFASELEAYIAARLGSGPDPIDPDTRVANLGVCVNEAIQAESVGP